MRVPEAKVKEGSDPATFLELMKRGDANFPLWDFVFVAFICLQAAAHQ